MNIPIKTMKKTILISFGTLTLSTVSGFAQDTIIKKNNEQVKAKILEIGSNEIKYRYYDAPNGPTIVIDRSEIKTLRVKGKDNKMVNVISAEPDGDSSSDLLIKKDKENEQIKVSIVEIGSDEIKFKYYDAPNGPTIALKKSEIKSLKVRGKDNTLVEAISTEIDKSGEPDIIIKKNNQQLKVKIQEVGENEVKYKYYDALHGPTLVIKKREIKTIKIKGKSDKSYEVINNEPDPMSTSNAIIQDKTSVLKFNFFSPLNHHIALGYEWMIKPGFNWETGIGFVGPGVGIVSNLMNDKPSGFFLRTGPKFLLGNSSDIEIEGARYAHPLKGKYFKVELIVYDINHSYENHINSKIYKVHNSSLGMSTNLIYGRQYIFGNAITVGWYFGVGYGFEKRTSDSKTSHDDTEYDIRRYSHYYYGKNFPLTTTTGFNVGYIFKAPSWIDRIAHHSGTNSTTPSRRSMSNDPKR